MTKCIFLDRDGVINREMGEYTYRLDRFVVNPGVVDALKLLKENGFLLIVLTNQAGISKGLYTEQDVWICHDHLQETCGQLIDDIYFCPYHSSITESLCRKPGSLMFEKAIAKHKIDPLSSWMVGDTERDIIPARKLSINTIQVGADVKDSQADFVARDLLEAANIIISTKTG
jgi:D-glycero-D-manno-heptose 1,7-bisphosphate phosphatase